MPETKTVFSGPAALPGQALHRAEHGVVSAAGAPAGVASLVVVEGVVAGSGFFEPVGLESVHCLIPLGRRLRPSRESNAFAGTRALRRGPPLSGSSKHQKELGKRGRAPGLRPARRHLGKAPLLRLMTFWTLGVAVAAHRMHRASRAVWLCLWLRDFRH